MISWCPAARYGNTPHLPFYTGFFRNLSPSKTSAKTTQATLLWCKVQQGWATTSEKPMNSIERKGEISSSWLSGVNLLFDFFRGSIEMFVVLFSTQVIVGKDGSLFDVRGISTWNTIVGKLAFQGICLRCTRLSPDHKRSACWYGAQREGL